MPDFFAFLIYLCGQKSVFLIKNLVFGVHFGVHILTSFSPYDKSPSRIFPEELFCFFKYYLPYNENNQYTPCLKRQGVYFSIL